MRICRKLASANPNSRTTHEAEIAELTKATVLRKAIREVDRGRVEVNTGRIIDGLPVEFIERVQRYATMQALGLSRTAEIQFQR